MSQAELDAILAEYIDPELWVELTGPERAELLQAVGLGPDMDRDQIIKVIKQEVGIMRFNGKIVFPDTRTIEEKQADFKRAINDPKPLEKSHIRKERECLEDLRVIVPPDPSVKDGPPDPKPADFADIFMKHFDFALIEKDKHLLVLQGGIYVDTGRVLVRSLIEKAYRESSNNFKREVVDKIGDLNPVKRTQFDQDPIILNCANGPFNLQTGDPAPDPHFFRKKLPVRFRPELGPSKL